MDQANVQQVFFQHIRNNLPAHLSLVDEIAELLNISNDSAYRRIRGEKGISFDELRTLCSHFKISLDQLFFLNSESIVFSGRNIDQDNISFELWLQNILRQLEFMNSFDRKEMIYLNKDVPIFHYFCFHELAAFKFFFWMKTILQVPIYSKALYNADDFMTSLHNLSGKIIDEYNKIPSQEIWSVENIHSSIRQIEYYKETKVFASGQDIVDLYEALEKTIEHIEKQAEAGFKFSVDGRQPSKKTFFKLYINEFVLSDNTILALLNDTKVVYLNHSILNFIATRDSAFGDYTYNHSQNIIRKSTLISDVGEKERSRFFNVMREKIQNRKKAVKNYSDRYTEG